MAAPALGSDRAWTRARSQAFDTRPPPSANANTSDRFVEARTPDFWSLVRSVWHAPIAALLGTDNRVLWRGSLAIRKAFFFDLQVPQLWQNAESGEDELRCAVANVGLQIVFAPAAMVACPGRTSMREFFGAARRQMIIARQHWPALWREALAAHLFYCGGMAAAIVASIRGSRGAEWALVVQLGLGMLKGHSLWVPLVTWIWLCVLLSSAFTRKISWLGRRYDDLPPASKTAS